MKKISALIFLFSFFISSNAVFAEVTPNLSTGKKILTVEGRGWVNLVTSPLELLTSSLREFKKRKYLGVITFAPQTATNFFYRVTSFVNDILLYPCVVPFTDNITPWTEYIGIPEYPWQMEYQ